MARKKPPGPRDFAFGMRTAAQMKHDVCGTALQFQRDYGDCVSILMGPYRFFFFYHPEQVRELLVTKSKSFIRFPRVMKTFAQWNGHSVLIAEGEAWAKQRRLVQQGFQPSRMAAYGEKIVTRVRQFSDSLTETLPQSGEIEIDGTAAMAELALSNICQTMFDVEPGDTTAEIAKAVAVLSQIGFDEMQAPIRRPLWLPIPHNARKKWAMRVLDQLVWKLVKERRASGKDGDDLLTKLLHAVDDESGGFKLDDRQVRDEVMTMLLAGYDTTAAGLEWLMYCLASHEEVAKKCYADVAALGDRPVTDGDIDRMPYLMATINETLRLYPPAIGIFVRQATANVEIGGYQVRKGELVMLSSFATQRDPRRFPEPEKFDPQRFLPPRDAEFPPFAYFPFGGGPRVCIGKMLALHEMALVAATLLQSWHITYPIGEPEPELDVKLALRPRLPLRLQFARRQTGDGSTNTMKSRADMQPSAE